MIAAVPPISDKAIASHDDYAEVNEPELGAVDASLKAEQQVYHLLLPVCPDGRQKLHLISYGDLTAPRVTMNRSMTLQRAALWAIVIAATMYLLVAGRGLLLPFVLGLVLWYMVDALADAFERPRLGRLRLPRPIALLGGRPGVMGGLVWIVGRTIGRNISAVVAAAPTYEGRLQKLIDAGRAAWSASSRRRPSASCSTASAWPTRWAASPPPPPRW